MNILKKLKKSNIRVTDIAAQFWCEKQMELGYIYGHKITAEIKKGKDIHEVLENETNIPIILMPKNYADALYKILYTSVLAIETLFENNKSREIQVYGAVDGFPLVGKVDMLELKDGAVILLEDKTKATDTLPNTPQLYTHKIQIMFYKKMLDELIQKKYTKEDYKRQYNIDKLVISDEFKRQLDALNVKKEDQNLDSIVTKYFSMFPKLGKIDDMLKIRYINQFTGNEIKTYKFLYDKNEVDNILKFILGYWKGEREALTVPESENWKCKYCGFYGKECTKWWPQKTLNNK
ncbi:MAG: PD-(D/E)XK nuclease family protein [Candidatus Micrarchaeia archaeon]